MSPYRVQNTESESDIKNYNFLNKNTPNAKILSNFWMFSKIEKNNFLFCIMYKLYNSYFVIFGFFVNFVILGLLDFCIYIYYTCRSLTRVGLSVSYGASVRGTEARESHVHICILPQYRFNKLFFPSTTYLGFGDRLLARKLRNERNELRPTHKQPLSGNIL